VHSQIVADYMGLLMVSVCRPASPINEPGTMPAY